MKKLTKSQVVALVKRNGSLVVELYPSKCSPENQTWVQGTRVDLLLVGTQVVHMDVDKNCETFDSLINSFSYYNCNSELGQRVHYYY